MSTIIQVELWADVGYQEGGIEVPSRSETLPTADIVYAPEGGINVSVGNLFSQMNIPKIFSDYMNMSYIRVTYDMNNPKDNAQNMQFYGWIDSISLKSDSEDYPSTIINWHVDLWRTFFKDATFGYGMVNRRSASDNDPPQAMSYVYRTAGDFKDISYKGPGDESQWVILNYVDETEDYKITGLKTMVIPISKDSPHSPRYIKSKSGVALRCPTLSDFITGRFDEQLAISASTVSSVYLSSVPPLPIKSGNGDASTPYEFMTEAPTTETIHTWDSVKNNSKYVISIDAGEERTTVRFSDGTSQRVNSSSYRSFFEGINGGRVHADTNRTDVTTYLNGQNIGDTFLQIIKISDYLAQTNPDTKFSNGDQIRFMNGAEHGQYTKSVNVKGVFNSVDITYTTVRSSNVTITYNNGWPDEYIRFYGESPYIVLGTQYATSIYSIDIQTNQYGSDTYAFAYSTTGNYYEWSQTLPEVIKTTDTTEWIVTDLSGIPVGSFPWGMEAKEYTVRCIISVAGCYVEYRFNGKDSHTNGMSFIIPMTSIDLASNSWCDYTLSGQREWDMRQREISAQQALVTSVTGSVNGATSNAIMGGIGGVSQADWNNYVGDFFADNPNMGAIRASTPDVVRNICGTHEQAIQTALSRATPPAVSFGAGKAMGASLAVGAMTAGIDFATTTYFNGQLQNAQDVLAGKQFDSITIPGNGWDWLWHGRPIGIVSLVADNYSLTRFMNDRDLNGIVVSEPMDDCTPIIDAEGPVAISELRVGGEIPVSAKSYIKGRFANGVRIRNKFIE